MHKRKTNSTRYDGRTRKLSWRVEWQFDSAGVKEVDASAQEDMVLGEVRGGVGWAGVWGRR